MSTEPNVVSFGSAPADGRGLHQLVVNRLGMMITSGELATGAKIAPDDVGASLGVSRTVVREALRVLQAKGLVRPRPKTGTRVLGPAEWDLLDKDVIGWRVRGPDRARQLSELLDLRLAVEVSAVRSACRNASDDDIAALQADCDDLFAAGASGDHAAFTEADIRFHNRLLTASANLVFSRFSESFAAVLVAREELATLPDHVDDPTLQEHRDLADAIAARDEQRAAAIATQIIEQSRAEVLASLNK
ncbi:FCD domain-containing protein [Epidermidibacterium keratini]|uniref:FCD domain-containing protein n=1 Tax=Epidermidibacterium keratini TaxID=1891644 RepID=A0A7L4YMX6_9ACTN|nr:FadR/GntR family transcriptional regulator [Epidermidibacterium keratini]QHC00625.1 FCD domain-containing protein [Epidermidibacterium keratini]